MSLCLYINIHTGNEQFTCATNALTYSPLPTHTNTHTHTHTQVAISQLGQQRVVCGATAQTDWFQRTGLKQQASSQQTHTKTEHDISEEKSSNGQWC